MTRLFPDPARDSLEQLLEAGPVDYERVSKRTRERLEKKHTEQREKALRRSQRTIYVLEAIGTAVPSLSRLAQNLKRGIMKKKAKDLFQLYMNAEGYQKWIFGIGALLAFVAALVQPEWVPFIVAGVFGAEAALKKYEEAITDPGENE
jgi:hypothetical protein